MKLIKLIHNTFIPTRNNSYHPYSLRMPVLATVATCLLLAQVAINVSAQAPNILGMQSSLDSNEVLRLSNEVRAQSGATELVMNERLQRAAQAKAEDMLGRGYWGHYAPDGTSPWYFVENENYSYQYAGENLARDFSTDEGVVRGWLQSPQHKDNLLDDRFSDAGLAVAHGRINGKDTSVVVALYAAPQPISVRLGESSALESGESVATEPVSYSFANPLISVAALPFASRLALIVSLVVSMVYALQHVVVSRKKLLWDDHIHPRPALCAVALLGVSVVLVQAGFGVVG